MSGRKGIFWAIAAALAVGGAASAAHAATLSDLIASGTPQVEGNLTYSDFSASGLTASDIVFTFSGGGATITFNAGWNSLSASTSTISYVITTASGYGITNAEASMLGVATVGSGQVTVDESVIPGVDNVLSYTNPNVNVFSANENLPSSSAESITDTIVTAAPTGGFATVSDLENTFTVTPTVGGSPIPEPMSLGILTPALLGLALRKRRAR